MAPDSSASVFLVVVTALIGKLGWDLIVAGGLLARAGVTGPRATATFHVKRSAGRGRPGRPVIDRMAEMTPAAAYIRMRPPPILEPARKM